jgi:hypothetical protein
MKKLSSAACVVAIVACSGPGQQSPAGTLSPSQLTTAPVTAAPPATAAATAGPAAITDTLNGGRYLFRPLADVPSLTIVARGPNGWVGYPSWAMDGPEPVRADAPTGIGVSFFSANGMYGDPCHWDVQGIGDAGPPGDVPVGPTVDDLVTALRANTFYTSSAAKQVTIDGYAGEELELRLPDDPLTTCDKDDPDDSDGHAFVFSGSGLYAQGPANRWHLYILNVEGTRLIAVILYYDGTPQADVDLAKNIIATLDINP